MPVDRGVGLEICGKGAGAFAFANITLAGTWESGALEEAIQACARQTTLRAVLLQVSGRSRDIDVAAASAGADDKSATAGADEKNAASAEAEEEKGAEEADAGNAESGDAGPASGEDAAAAAPAETAAAAAEDAAPAASAAAADAAAEATSAGDNVAAAVLAERLAALPQLIVAYVEGSTTCAETCLLAACDAVYAVSDAVFALTITFGATLPLCLLRLLGGERLDALVAAAASSDTVGALAALDAGLVSDLCTSEDALHRLRDAFASDLGRGAASALAAQRWAARRSRGGLGRKRSIASGTVDLPQAKRPRLQLGDSDTTMTDKMSSASAALVLRELSQGASLPEPANSLLAKVVSRCLATPRDKRETFQTEIMDMIDQALEANEAAEKDALATVTTLLENADAERATRDAARAASESRLLSARCQVNESKTLLYKATSELRELAAALETARGDEALGNSSLDEALAKKTKLVAAQRDSFEPLRDGTLTGAKLKKQTTNLVNIGKQYEFDETLLMGLPHALAAKPDKRTECDNMFLRAFEAEIQSQISTIEIVLAEGEPAREARAAAVQEKREVHDEALKKQSEASSTVVKAQAAVKEEEAKLKRLTGVADALSPEVQRLTAESETLKKRLAALGQLRLAAKNDDTSAQDA
eukprot:TRINITY_DN47138_c0_g1_i1.p1 TRINITY_DN47138_c0_g1~~TRINITY_DN47138_c0_g1_i1.p1  ORF type:complete len:675 (-),score=167.10 TRINITY_DN47138_c0_g1_i1:144-2099(-)